MGFADDDDAHLQLNRMRFAMTRGEFFEVLAQTARDWRLIEGKIRRGPDRTLECPITGVAGLFRHGPQIPAISVITAAYDLGLDAVFVSSVVSATDDIEPCDPLVRMQLMDACGLLVEEGVREVTEAEDQQLSFEL